MRSLLSTKKLCRLRTFSLLYFLVLLTTLCELKHLANTNEELFDLFEEDVTEGYYTEYYDYDDELDKASCEDDLPKENCTSVANAGKCGDRQDKFAMLCMKTCGYCKTADGSYEEQSMRNVEDADETNTSDEVIDEETSSTSSPSSSEIEMQEDYRKDCEDKLPTCEAHYSQEFCCQMKQSMNYSCEKTCKFCSQTPASLAPPGGNGYVPAAPVPTATSNQDPCRNNEGKPPSVTVDTPSGQGVPGVTTTTTTTTTSNPIQGALTPSSNTQLPIHSW